MFLFANVTSSDMRILAFLKWTRLDRFIASAVICPGLSDSLISDALPQFVTYSGSLAGVQGLVDSVNIILSTFDWILCRAIISIVLNQIFTRGPETLEQEVAEAIVKADSKQAAKIAAEMEEAENGDKVDMKHLLERGKKF